MSDGLVPLFGLVPLCRRFVEAVERIADALQRYVNLRETRGR